MGKTGTPLLLPPPPDHRNGSVVGKGEDEEGNRAVALTGGSPLPPALQNYSPQKKSWRAAIIVLIVIVLGAGLGWFRWRDHIWRGDYQLETVPRTNLEIKVLATGLINPLVTVPVRAPVTGVIAQVLVEVNSEVKSGQVLARLDPAHLQFKIDQAKAHHLQAQADLAQSQAKLEEAKLNYKRCQAQWNQNLVSREEFDKAYTGYANALVDVQGAKTRLQEAETAWQKSGTALHDNTIVSPVDGIVVVRQLKAGQTIAAGPQTTPLFVIATSLMTMQVEATLEERDGVRVQEGQSVTFSIDSTPGRTFAGVVTRITQIPHTGSTYQVIIQAENPDLALRPGMPAKVAITLAQRRQVLAVPEAALSYRPAGEEAGADDSRVWKIGPNRRPVPVAVETGLSAPPWTEIIKGELQEGDQVIVAPRR